MSSLILVPPTVQILKPTDDVYRVHAGQELALVCRGSGDPTPTIKCCLLYTSDAADE